MCQIDSNGDGRDNAIDMSTLSVAIPIGRRWHREAGEAKVYSGRYRNTVLGSGVSQPVRIPAACIALPAQQLQVFKQW